MPSRIVHCTSVHQWDDVRIFHKMARSLAGAGCDAHVVALDRKAQTAREFVEQGVTIHLLPGADIRSRPARLVKGGWRVAAKARALGADIVHVHDPELIPFLFGGFGRKARLIYDAHEDLVGQIDAKPWVPARARPLLRATARLLELAARRADVLIAATPVIAAKLATRAVAVQNFPLAEEFAAAGGRVRENRAAISTAVYAGGITRARGTIEMIEAVGQVVEIERFHLAGGFESDGLFQQAQALPGWAKVEYHHVLPRDRLMQLLGEADIGVLTFLPYPNHVSAQPNKLFEYLSAGLLIVASDFPAWRALLSSSQLAEFVDPADPASIAAGLRRTAALPAEEQQRRRAVGRAMVAGQINWEAEFRKLLTLCESL
jgi:glycosyltransferase involved in cell wall biosynthesis